MSHRAFLQRPNYRHVQRMQLAELRHDAREQRAQGLYNCETLWLYRTCYLRSRTFSDWLDYLSFRRDLGYPPNQHQAEKLKQQNSLKLWFKAKGRRSLVRRAEKLKGQITKLQSTQSHFQHEIHSLSVVGNSPNIKGTSRGELIDSYAHVLRFNHCFSTETDHSDVGSKFTMWCIAPGYRGPIPNGQELKWLILAGPDMANWQLNTEFIAQVKHRHPAINIHSIPLSTWRKLVRILAAPPSAGVLVLAFLRELEITYKTFGFGHKDDQQYHHALPNHKAVSRHNWKAEAMLLQQLAS